MIVAACSDSTAPARPIPHATLASAKCGTVKVNGVIKNMYNVTATLQNATGEPWRAWFVKDGGVLLTDVRDSQPTKQSGCVYIAGSTASAYLFIGGSLQGDGNSTSSLTPEINVGA